MNERIAFTLYVEPKSLQFSARRERIVQPKSGKQFIHHYKDKKAISHENALAALCAPHVPPVPLLGSLRLTLVYVFDRPNRFNTKKSDPGRIDKDTRPDLTNVTKGVEDAFTRAGFWEDDRQIQTQLISKFYAARGEPACIEVTIETLSATVPQEELFSVR